MQKTSFPFFCLTLPKNFMGNPFVFQKISGIEKKLWMRGGGITFFRRKFFVSQCRKTSWGNSFVFQKISDMEKIMDKRGGGGGGITIPRRKIFCLTLPKNFVGHPSLFDKISGIEKFFAWGGYHDFQSGVGGSTIFCRLFYVSQYRNFRRGTL